jgi:hypothetical protein
MSDRHATGGTHDDEIVAPHGTDDHGEDAGHDEHADERLGPIDVVAWTYGVVGVLLGLLVVAGFAIAAGWVAVG